MKAKFTALCLLASTATPVFAADSSVSGEVEYTSFDHHMGHRTVGSVWADFDLGDTTVVAKGSAGERAFPIETYKGVEGELTVYHDWNDLISTRTSASISSNDVVFAKHSFEQDINLKLLPKTVFLVGIKHVKYANDTRALVLSGGATRYFKRGFVSYRYNHFDLNNLGNSHSHLVSARLTDKQGAGYLQLWMSRGTALQENDVAAVALKGHTTGVALKRVQPLSDKLSLDLTMGSTWYDNDYKDYTGLTGKIGLTFGL